LSLQAARQFGHEGAGDGRIGARHVGHQQIRPLGFFSATSVIWSAQVLASRAGCGLGHARGHAAQVFDQRQAQHDGDGPQLAQLSVATSW
jgi:hypothetical protein